MTFMPHESEQAREIRLASKRSAIAATMSQLCEDCFDAEEVQFAATIGLAAIAEAKRLGWI